MMSAMVTRSFPELVADHVRRVETIRARRTEALLREMFLLPAAGCRGIAPDPPVEIYGRGVFFKHEFPKRRLWARLFRVRGRCFCGELPRR